MKRTFESLASKNKIIYNNDFAKILEEHHVPKNLINLTIDYLKKYTQKEYFSFNDIKYFFSNLDYSLPLINKKKFLFKMILDIYSSEDKLTYNQIEKYLNIDYSEENHQNNSGENDKLFGEDDFLKENSVFDKMIKKINTQLDNFGLLPYLLFKAKANDKKVKRKLIQTILKNDGIDNYEKYLENNFDQYKDFYAIDINFWNLLMNEKEDAPDFINNSNIAEDIILIKEEDKYNEELFLLMNDKDKQKNKNKKEESNKETKKEENNKNNSNQKSQNDKIDNNNKDKKDEKKDIENNKEKVDEKKEIKENEIGKIRENF